MYKSKSAKKAENGTVNIKMLALLTDKQKEMLPRYFGHSRFVYNYCLQYNQELYKKEKRSLNYRRTNRHKLNGKSKAKKILPFFSTNNDRQPIDIRPQKAVMKIKKQGKQKSREWRFLPSKSTHRLSLPLKQTLSENELNIL